MGVEMGIISWIVLGLIAGAIAKFIMPGDDPGGIVVTGLIGIAGGVIGGIDHLQFLGGAEHRVGCLAGDAIIAHLHTLDDGSCAQAFH